MEGCGKTKVGRGVHKTGLITEIYSCKWVSEGKSLTDDIFNIF